MGTHKNEVSITEFPVEIVDISGVFFPPNTSNLRNTYDAMLAGSNRDIQFAIHILNATSRELGMLLAIRIWLHWLKFFTPPKDRAQAPVQSRLLKILQPECRQTSPDVARRCLVSDGFRQLSNTSSLRTV